MLTRLAWWHCPGTVCLGGPSAHAPAPSLSPWPSALALTDDDDRGGGSPHCAQHAHVMHIESPVRSPLPQAEDAGPSDAALGNPVSCI